MKRWVRIGWGDLAGVFNVHGPIEPVLPCGVPGHQNDGRVSLRSSAQNGKAVQRTKLQRRGFLAVYENEDVFVLSNKVMESPLKSLKCGVLKDKAERLSTTFRVCSMLLITLKSSTIPTLLFVFCFKRSSSAFEALRPKFAGRTSPMFDIRVCLVENPNSKGLLFANSF